MANFSFRSYCTLSKGWQAWLRSRPPQFDYCQTSAFVGKVYAQSYFTKETKLSKLSAFGDVETVPLPWRGVQWKNRFLSKRVAEAIFYAMHLILSESLHSLRQMTSRVWQVEKFIEDQRKSIIYSSWRYLFFFQKLTDSLVPHATATNKFTYRLKLIVSAVVHMFLETPTVDMLSVKDSWAKWTNSNSRTRPPDSNLRRAVFRLDLVLTWNLKRRAKSSARKQHWTWRVPVFPAIADVFTATLIYKI